jgi:O-antigen/teichoic acid export membrane protein
MSVEPLGTGAPLRRRRLAGRALAAVTSQGVTAGGSLILQIITARELGLAGYGAYALCLALLGSATAIYTGYVGDGLVMLDRRDPATRQGLTTSAVASQVPAGAIALGMVLLLHLGDVGTALIYCGLVLVWLIEETGRRILMARLEFWGLVVNDVSYVVVSLAALGVFAMTGVRLTLASVLGAMGIGAVVAIAVALVQLPAEEYRGLRIGRAGLRAVASFSVWRSMQVSLTAAQLLLSRVVLQQMVSLSAVGQVESGRLVVAPIQTVINGSGSFLLSTSAEAERNPRGTGRRMAERAALMLGVLTLLGGVLAAGLAHPLGRIMVGRNVSPLLVLGWVLYLATWALAMPFVSELVARRLTKQVFWIRLIDSALALGAVIVGLGVGLSPLWTPWLLSAGGLVTVVLVRRLAVRTRPASALAS